jgi:hypothetical protein
VRPPAGPALAASTAQDRKTSTVTVTGTNLAGRPDNGAPVTVVNVDQASRFDSPSSVGFFRHGLARFTVPDGHYWAFAVYFAGSAARLVTVPQFTVAGPTTVHTAARMATSKVTVVTPRPAVLREVSTEMLRGSGTGPPSSEGATLEGGGVVYVSPVLRHPTVGGIRLFTSDEFGSPPGTHVPYRYLVSYAGPVGTIPAAERYRVRAGDLTTVDESYYRSSPSRGWWRVSTWNRYPLHPDANVVLAPQPRHWGVVPSAERDRHTLRLDITPFTDNQPGDIGTGFGHYAHSAVTGSYQIDANGRRVAGGNAVKTAGGDQDLSVQAPMSSGSSVIRVSLTASRRGPGFGLATSSHTVWTWPSASGPSATLPPGWYCWISLTGRIQHSCTVQPMMTLDYDVARLGPAESAPPGRQSVTVTAGHLQLARAARVTGASVRASFDGGRTWRAARVRPLGRGRFLATFTAPAQATVALVTTATDASGGSISETITGAYRTGPRPRCSSSVSTQRPCL